MKPMTTPMDPFFIKTVYDMTSGKYNELKVMQPAIVSASIAGLRIMLKKVGVELPHVKNEEEFDVSIENGLKRFHQKYNIPDTTPGILTDSVLGKILDKIKEVAGDIIEDDEEENTADTSDEATDSPHYLSFFSGDNEKIFRKNKTDILINVGNNITKTIVDVHMRSLGMEFDTSGNPISEMYEFIARDVLESDEKMDKDKYEKDEHNTPSDVEYKFNFGKTK